MDFDFDEDLGEEKPEEEEKPVAKPAAKAKTPLKSKTPAPAPSRGKKISLYFLSTIGPGEKRQKLTVDDSNNVGAVKKTVGNIFGLDPDDFHLSSGGVTMDENTSLASYNLSNGDEVLLIPASTAG